VDIWNLLLDVVVLLGVGLVLGALCERARQSAILGYLATGALLGPSALHLVESGAHVEALAELGVSLLLFAIGLEFSWSRLRRMGAIAFGGGSAQVLATTTAGAALAMLLGMEMRASLALGAVLALSSTASILRILTARGELESVHGGYAVGVLLLQDIAVVPLVLLVGVLADGGGAGSALLGLGRAAAIAAVLVAILFLVFNRLAPRLLRSGPLHANRELPVLFAAVAGLGSAVACHSIGLSPALGSFVAGMLLAESPFAVQIRADISSMRTLLMTLFFASVGMLTDPVWMASHAPLVLGTVAAVVFGKAGLSFLVLRGFGASREGALAAGIALSQIGEFSFVLAAAGRGTLFSEDTFLLIVSTTVFTIFLTPFLVSRAPQLAGRICGGAGAAGAVDPVGVMEGASPGVLLVGFGPAGRGAAERILASGQALTVIDQNSATSRTARTLGFTAVTGDARHAEVLEHAGVRAAWLVVVTIPDPRAAAGVVSLVRAIAPQAIVIARARFHIHRQDIEGAGAHVVIDEEQDVGERIAAAYSIQLEQLPGTESESR